MGSAQGKKLAAAMDLQRLERWPIDRPRPSIRNSRSHSETQIEELSRSLDEFGQVKPIVVDELDEILAGHGTLAGANLLGWKFVLVLVVPGLSEEKKRAYRIADNALGLKSTWDLDVLKTELMELKLEDVDLETTGLDVDLIEELTLPAPVRSREGRTTRSTSDSGKMVECPHCHKEFLLTKQD